MGKHWWPLPLLVIVIAGAAVAITYFTKTGMFSDSESSGRKSSQKLVDQDSDAKNQESCNARNKYFDADAKECKVCPEPKKYFAVFWESHVDGCLEFKNNPDAFKYITHVYWGFAEIDESSGEVGQTFQGNDDTLKNCMASMRNKCVKQLASIGGATNRARFLSINSPEKIQNFGKTAAQLVEKFNFDGIDIDDESGNGLLGGTKTWYEHSPNVVGYLKAAKAELAKLSKKPGEPAYTLTWDEFPQSIDKKTCNETNNEWKRCYNEEISDVVDWVNLMVYNAETEADYDNFLNTIIPDQWATEIPSEKIVVGGCVGEASEKLQGACGYGASPSKAQLNKYASDGSSKYGGTMLWTASADYTYFKLANIQAMGKSGNYGALIN